MSVRSPGTGLIFACLVALTSSGCATYGEGGGGIRTWQTEPVDQILDHRPPHDRIRVVVDGEPILLEGARLARDSVIGFREVDDDWERFAIPRDRPDRLEVKKLHTGWTVLTLGSTAALLVWGIVTAP